MYAWYLLIRDLLGRAAAGWQRHNSWQMSAALAFYSLLSLAPLCVLAIAVASFWFGDKAARGELFTQLDGLLGAEGAAAVQNLVARSHALEWSGPASFVGIATLLIGASAVFGQLQESMNTIWETPPVKGLGLGVFVRQRLIAFAMTLAMGGLLIVSLLLSAAISGVRTYLPEDQPLLVEVSGWSNDVIALVLLFGLVALIFKFLPDRRVPFRDVWPGALCTAILLAVGKWALAWYLGAGGFASAYGAAGSLVVVILWVYYSSQILFFGAELTHALSVLRAKARA